jgi:hypothetical protein
MNMQLQTISMGHQLGSWARDKLLTVKNVTRYYTWPLTQFLLRIGASEGPLNVVMNLWVPYSKRNLTT